MICSCCHHVLELKEDYALISNERDGEDPLTTHHRDGKSLTAAVDAGCYICNRLWAALDMEERCQVRHSVNEPTKREAPATESPLTSVFWDDGAAFAYPRAVLLQLTFDQGKVMDLERNPRKGFFRLTILLLPQECMFTCRETTLQDFKHMSTDVDLKQSLRATIPSEVVRP